MGTPALPPPGGEEGGLEGRPVGCPPPGGGGSGRERVCGGAGRCWGGPRGSRQVRGGCGKEDRTRGVESFWPRFSV